MGISRVNRKSIVLKLEIFLERLKVLRQSQDKLDFENKCIKCFVPIKKLFNKINYTSCFIHIYIK